MSAVAPALVIPQPKPTWQFPACGSGSDFKRYYAAEATLSPQDVARMGEALKVLNDNPNHIITSYAQDRNCMQAQQDLGLDLSVSHKDAEAIRAYLSEENDKRSAAYKVAQEALVARLAKERTEAIDAMALELGLNAGATAWMHKTCTRGTPSQTSLTEWFKKSLMRVTPCQYGTKKDRPAYAPEPSGYKLLLDKVVHFSGAQDSYADYSYWLIPVEVTDPVDNAAAHRNLGQISRKLDSHNGWAGSGSTYSMELATGVDGAFITMHARHSLSD